MRHVHAQATCTPSWRASRLLQPHERAGLCWAWWAAPGGALLPPPCPPAATQAAAPPTASHHDGKGVDVRGLGGVAALHHLGGQPALRGGGPGHGKHLFSDVSKSFFFGFRSRGQGQLGGQQVVRWAGSGPADMAPDKMEPGGPFTHPLQCPNPPGLPGTLPSQRSTHRVHGGHGAGAGAQTVLQQAAEVEVRHLDSRSGQGQEVQRHRKAASGGKRAACSTCPADAWRRGVPCQLAPHLDVPALIHQLHKKGRQGATRTSAHRAAYARR